MSAPARPLSLSTRSFIAHLQRSWAVAQTRRGLSIDEAAAGAAYLGESFGEALASGELIEMPENALLCDLRAGRVPEEWGQ